MRHAKLRYGLAGVAALAAGAWILLAARTPEQQSPAPVPASATQDTARPAANLPVPTAPPARTVEPSTPSAVFEARFKASREAPRPPPDPAIANARTFAEAFQAMKRAEVRPPPDSNAGTSPFGPAR